MDDLISKLSEIRSEYNCFDEAERQYYHALSEAIRELSGRADGDTIYRQDAIDGVKTLHDVAWKNWHEPTLSANVVLDMIGELPSAQPDATDINVGGTIYRQAAIDAMCDACLDWCDEGVCKKVSALQKLPPAQQWIPCSERLPEDGENVLVTYKTTDKIHPCQYHDDGSRNPWYSYIDQCRAHMNVVLAWMPLPEPYQEERREDG